MELNMNAVVKEERCMRAYTVRLLQERNTRRQQLNQEAYLDLPALRALTAEKLAEEDLERKISEAAAREEDRFSFEQQRINTVWSQIIRDSDEDEIYKGHDFLAPFNAGWKITGYNPLVEEKSAVKQVRYYSRARGRPNKKTLFAPSKSDHGSTLIAANLSGFLTLHQQFLGGVRAFSSLRTRRPTVRMGREFINNKPLRQFTLSNAKSAGRNSAGRITIFHQGGGAKRLQRRIDLKRSTSSMGIVERIEYDPNRSSRIALVRWEKGVQLNRQGKCKTIEEFAPPPRKIFEPTTTTNFGSFSFSSMPGKVDQRKVACFSPRQMGTYVPVGLPTSKSPFTSKGGVSRKSSAKEILLSTLSPNATGACPSFTLDSSSSFPRMAVAGAKPAFLAPRMKENVGGEKGSSPCEIRKLTRRSFLGAHRMKRKAAVSWQSLGVTTKHNESKLKMDQVSLRAKKLIGDRTPLTYIIASQQLEAGSMVMNCDPSLRP